MRRARIRTGLKRCAALAALVVIVVQCGERIERRVTGDGPPLGIEARLPEGEVPARSTVSVVFDRPVTRLGDPDPDATRGRAWMVLDPPVEGAYHWVGTRTLTFTASRGLPAATAFTVRVPARVRAVDGAELRRDVEWRFTTPRPALMASVPAPRDSLARPGDPIVLRFNIDVEPAAVAAAATLEPGTTWRASRPDSALRRELDQRFWGADDATLVRLDPQPPLAADRASVLRLAAGLRARGGPLGLESAIEIPFRTYGAPGLVAAIASGPGGVRLVFRTPVDADSARARLVFDPPLQPQSIWQDGTSLHVWGALDYDTVYTVTATAGLVDVFGQRFTTAHTVTFTSSEREPTLQLLPREAVLLPGTSRTVAMVASGMGAIRVRAARVGVGDEIRARNQPLAQRRWTFDRRFAAAPDAGQLVHESIDLASLLPRSGLGAVVVEAQATPRGPGQQQWETRAVLRWSDLGVAVKMSAENGLVWTTHMGSGATWRDVALRLLDETGVELWSGKSDARGLASTPGTRSLGREPWQVSLVASSGADTTTSSLQGDWRLDPWRFQIPGTWGTPPVPERAFLWSDRDVFRPGDSVRLAGLVRRFVPSGLAACGLDSVTIAVRDPVGRTMLERRLPIDARGGFALDLPLAADAALGRYGVAAIAVLPRTAAVTAPARGRGRRAQAAPAPASPPPIQHTLGTYGFELAAFRAPAFRVAVVPRSRHIFLGDIVDAGIEAGYYFGAPLAGVDFQWQATRERHAFTPRGFDDFTFDDAEIDIAHGGALASGRGAVGDSGTARVTFILPPELPPVTQAIHIEATVRDAAGDAVSAHAGVLLHPAPVYAGVRVTTDFVTAGQPVVAQVVAVAADSAIAVPGTPLQLELIRREWRAVRKLLVGGRVGYETAQLDSVIETRSAIAGAEPVALEFTPATAGAYRIRVRATAPGGATSPAAVTSFWVAGSGPGAFPLADAVRIELATDRSNYRVGDTARVLVTTPLRSERALLTIEREGLIESRLVDVRAGSQVFDVEIRPEYLPNVYVGIAAVEPVLSAADAPSLPEAARLPRYVAGYVPLRIDVSERRLAVEVATGRETYAPGERAEVIVQVRDAAGAPASGHVAIAVVDEAVLALLGTPMPDPFGFFYGERALGVATSDTRLRLSAGSRLESAAFKATGAAGDGGEKLAARSMFTTTAYWNPRVDVGPDGRARIEFTLPDNLTSFRVVALAASGVDRFGAGRTSLRVTKPLIVESALPRFAQAGDTLELACVVTNQLPTRQRVAVQVVTDLTLLGSAQSRVDVGAGATRRVAFRARAERPGAAAVRFEVRARDAVDAVERTLPVDAGEVERVAATAVHAVGRDGGTITSEVIAIPPRAVAPPTLEVTLGASALAGARPAFMAVIDYPYGCLEQHASRLLVLLLQRRLFGADAGAGAGADTVQARAQITATIHEIESLMSPWGGFSFWDGGAQAPDWMQAYALLALTRARRAGFVVADATLENGAWRLVRAFREGPRGDVSGRDGGAPAVPADDSGATVAAEDEWWMRSALGLGLFVLSELYPVVGDATPVQPADIALLVDRVDRLPEEERVFLAMALRTWGRRPEIPQRVWRNVLRRAEVSAETATVPAANDEARAFVFRTGARATSLALWLGSRVAAEEPMLPKLAAGLLAMRARGRWQTTQDDALALSALDAYRDGVERQGGPVRVEAALVESGTRIVDLAAPAGGLDRRNRSLELAAALAPSGQATLAFTGSGALHAATVLRWREPGAAQMAIEAGYSLVRRLRRLDGRGALRVGDLVVVTLELVVPRESYYLALVDPLPAGLEIVQPHFQIESRRVAEALVAPEDGLISLPVSHVERRDRELRAFADHVPAGVYAHRYVARVRAAGGFAHAPAHVEAMYTPELRAATGATRFRARPPQAKVRP